MIQWPCKAIVRKVLANIPWLAKLSVIAPIAAGAVRGNLDKDLRCFFWIA